MDVSIALSVLSLVLGIIGAANALFLVNKIKREQDQDEHANEHDDLNADVVVNGRHLSLKHLSVSERRSLMRKLNALQ